jgi:uncharacterized protein YndB with AHSA1/START domain
VMGAGTVNTLTLEEHEGKTLMTQTIACKSRQARDSILQTGMEGGANESMQRLADLLQKLK